MNNFDKKLDEALGTPIPLLHDLWRLMSIYRIKKTPDGLIIDIEDPYGSDPVSGGPNTATVTIRGNKIIYTSSDSEASLGYGGETTFNSNVEFVEWFNKLMEYGWRDMP